MKPPERRFHEVAGIFPMMSQDEIDDLAEDIKKHGQREPILTFGGQIIDGRNRFLACRRLGVEPVVKSYDGEPSGLIPFVVSLNMHRRHLSTSQRAAIAADLAAMEDPTGKFASTQEDVAEAMGVSERSVRTAAKVKREDPEKHEQVKRGEVSVNAAATSLASHQAIHQSKSNEWYTPSEYIEAAREVMGSIDLDPASNAIANETVRAATFFGQEHDGLSQPWHGNVWLNPPYGKTDGESNAGIWTQEAIARFSDGETTQTTALVNSATDTSWFKYLWPHVLCFTDHRIKFIPGEGNPKRDGPTHGNVFMYLGPNVDLFVDVFSDFGRCVVPAGDRSEAR